MPATPFSLRLDAGDAGAARGGGAAARPPCGPGRGAGHRALARRPGGAPGRDRRRRRRGGGGRLHLVRGDACLDGDLGHRPRRPRRPSRTSARAADAPCALVYLPSTRGDLLWLRHYYTRVFPEGAAAARARMRAMERLILDNPHAGRPTHRAGVRRLPIARTPFFVLYRVGPRADRDPAGDRRPVLRLAARGLIAPQAAALFSPKSSACSARSRSTSRPAGISTSA